MTDEPLLTLKEFAERKRVPYVHLRRLVAEGVFPATRFGRRLYVDRAIAEEWIRAGGAALPGGWRRAPKDAAA